MLTSIKSHRARNTVTFLQRETPGFIPQRCGHEFTRFESGDYSVCLGYPSREVLPFVDPWCEGVERTSAYGVEAAGPLYHGGSDWAVEYSRLSACVRVNGGHFEYKFWTCDFLACFVRFVFTGFRKFDRHKHVHVQSANIAWNLLLLCLNLLHGIYGSNKTNL